MMKAEKVWDFALLFIIGIKYNIYEFGRKLVILYK